MLKIFIGLTLAMFLFCIFSERGTTMDVQDFKNSQPRLVLEEYLSGPTRATGILFSRSGEVKRQFQVDMHGAWDGQILTLEEDFVFSDGEKQHRTWKVKKLDEHTYEGTAGDVVGTATGKQYGSALNWSYTLKVPVGERTYHIGFDDWMFLGADGILLNRATMRKFGFTVGELFLAFHKVAEPS